MVRKTVVQLDFDLDNSFGKYDRVTPLTVSLTRVTSNILKINYFFLFYTRSSPKWMKVLEHLQQSSYFWLSI